MLDLSHDFSDEPVFTLSTRGVLRLSGPDRLSFLQGLVSNDVGAVQPDRPVYACLLTPQGKFLHDLFLFADGESLFLDCESDRRGDLLSRLKTYKLRSKIELTDVTDDFAVYVSLKDDIGPADPRSSALGYRAVLPRRALPDHDCIAYDRLRIALAVPDGSRDMEVGKAILLENNIDLLNGISWTKGCYTGQELTARTHYRGLIKKRLVPVRIDGAAPAIGTPLLENGVEIGEMRSSAGDIGLALLKLDIVRQARAIQIDGNKLTPEIPVILAEAIQAEAVSS